MKNKTNLGQNFLVDEGIVKKIIKLSQIGKNDVVYEVGTGTGTLTKELCNIAKFVYSFELDSKLFEQSNKQLKFDNLKLFNLDGLNEKLNLEFDVFFSSLPYYESRRAMSWLCKKHFKRGIVLLQKDFVEKLVSKPGEKNYRAISVLTQYRFSINMLLKVSPSSFFPKPRVESLLVELLPKNSPLSQQIVNDIQFLYSFRKKTVSFVLNYFNKHYTCSFFEPELSAIASTRIAELNPIQLLWLNDTLKTNSFAKEKE
ncbi:ribosomal RNA small subunit methyltransferase A [Candidatus Nitrosocosmicus franklandus]|uniref:Ribosomal RNA small subunit methyltransferase A n=1 Tax=Candidatus Nitrosocosmicus franklandianus TaxID=1798806 RepID=A0A484II60_9ARCH|nr:rRNA adenine N-6-methyltransferase family protein [Candidatus Nitrosocosmicus franklandus]VFJ14578.1 Ribosomal RNA small subunit methyltransferase A [Candidatus Nitrosocosmicus franklandus]